MSLEHLLLLWYPCKRRKHAWRKSRRLPSVVDSHLYDKHATREKRSHHTEINQSLASQRGRVVQLWGWQRLGRRVVEVMDESQNLYLRPLFTIWVPNFEKGSQTPFHNLGFPKSMLLEKLDEDRNHVKNTELSSSSLLLLCYSQA